MKIDTRSSFTLELTLEELREIHNALVSERSKLAPVLLIALKAAGADPDDRPIGWRGIDTTPEAAVDRPAPTQHVDSPTRGW